DSRPSNAIIKATGMARTYNSYAEYVARAKSTNEEILARLEPLTTPLGDEAIVVILTSEYLKAKSESSFTGPEEYRNTTVVRDFINGRFDYDEMIWTMLPRQIERRHIFKNVTVARANTANGIAPPPSGYVFWVEDMTVPA